MTKHKGIYPSNKNFKQSNKDKESLEARPIHNNNHIHDFKIT